MSWNKIEYVKGDKIGCFTFIVEFQTQKGKSGFTTAAAAYLWRVEYIQNHDLVKYEYEMSIDIQQFKKEHKIV